MWFFMISSYVLSLLSLLMLIVALVQNLFGFLIFQADQLTFIILTSLVYLFTETLVIFFFVGTGISVREYSFEKSLGDKFTRQALAIKKKVYPPLMLNMLLMIILFVLLGAVDTHHLPALLYRVYFIFCLWHFLYSKEIQHQAFRDMTENILAMSGIERESAR